MTLLGLVLSGKSPSKLPHLERGERLAYVSQTGGKYLRLASISSAQAKPRVVWKRAVLPNGAELIHAAADPLQSRIVVLYSTGGRSEVRFLRARDGEPTSAPTRVSFGESRLVVLGGKLWLVSSDGLTDFQLVRDRVPQGGDDRNPSDDSPAVMERSNFDFCLRPGTPLMYHAESHGYLDASQGDVSAYDFSGTPPRRTWGFDSDFIGIHGVASTPRCLLAVTDDGEVLTFGLGDPRHPALVKRRKTNDAWIWAWGDARRELFYVVREAGLQAFRVGPDGTLVGLPSVLPTDGAEVHAFADLGDEIALFTLFGKIKIYKKRSDGSLKAEGEIVAGEGMNWPVSLWE